jgi:hypothetical protein
VDESTGTSTRYLAIDPGEICGWAAFDHQGHLLEMDQIPMDEMGSLLDCFPSLLWVICEDYVINPNIPHGGSRAPTIRIIGQIQEWCRNHNTSLKIQPNRIKKIGYAWAGIKPLPKSRHAESHQRDAVAHGVYFLQKNGIRMSVLDEP